MSNPQVLALIYGGKSSEHEVSLHTAYSIMSAIDYTRYHVLPLYIQLDGTWVKGQLQQAQVHDVEDLRLTNPQEFSVFALAQEATVFMPVVHGPLGEDGTLQGMLEMMNVPYVGSGVLASALGMDKIMMKKMFHLSEIPQGAYQSVHRREIELDCNSVCQHIEEELDYPCFVKPANLGSSVGISKVKTRAELEKALLTASQYDQKIIIEQFINGRELEIGVLGNEHMQTSVVGEITTTGEFYDYEAKYKGGGAELIIPANIPQEISVRMAEIAKKCFSCLGCAGLARIDFFWVEDTNELFVNEINTMPGFTPFSMYPLLFKECSVAYDQLIEQLIALALDTYEDKQRNQVTAERISVNQKV